MGNILHQSNGADNRELNNFWWMNSRFSNWEKLMVSFPLYPLNASRQEMLSAVAATLRITKQKNSFKGVCVHHGSLEGQVFACTVKALARRVAHIWLHTSNGTTLLCAYWYSVGRGDVTDRDMSFHMKFAAEKIGYTSRNIPLDRIDTHSDRAGRACAMKLEIFDDESIIKMGNGFRRLMLYWNTLISS